MPLVNTALIFLTFLVFVPDYLASLDSAELLYNSDLVQPYLIVGDLVRDPSSLFAWYLSPAPYVFPDWFLSAAVMALPLPAGWLPLVYGAIMFTLYSVAGAAILVSCDAISRYGISLSSWAMAATLCGAGALVMVLAGPGTISEMLYTTLAAPYIHTGAALATLAASALFLRILHDCNRTSVAVLAGLTLAVSFSDALFFVWFVCPAVVTALLLAWSTRQIAAIWLALSIAISGIAGLAIDPLLRGISHLPASAPFDSTIRMIQTSLELGISRGDLPVLFMLLLVLAVMMRGAFLTIKTLRRYEPTRSEAMELLLAGICATGVLAPIFANQVLDLGSWRYFLILSLVPLVWLTFHILRILKSFDKSWALKLVPVVLGAYCLLFAVPSFNAAREIAGPSPMQTCIEAEGRNAGLGGYWSAKKIIFSSERRIHVAQIHSNGSSYNWNFNRNWFDARADNGEELDLKFIIPGVMDKEKLQLEYGRPDKIIDCEGDELWLYGRSLHIRSG